MKNYHSRFNAVAAALLACSAALASQAALAVDIQFRSFSASAAIGPPAEEYARKLKNITTTALGPGSEVNFVKLCGTPTPSNPCPIPAINAKFGGDIVAAVAEGGVLTGGLGFDAAYISGGDLNRAWGFLYNSAVPFGPTFDEYMGFLYGRSVDGGAQTGLGLLQSLLDKRGVVAIPIVGSPEQGSGWFPQPIGNVPGMPGIGLEGLCQSGWTMRYLPPAEFVLGRACDNLVGSAKNIKFIAAVPGGGSLLAGVRANTLHAFEFATPTDDISQLFVGADNPGTVSSASFGPPRFLHFPGWQQQFLLTHMIVNKQVWDRLTPGQQELAKSMGRDHVVSSYGENLRTQGPSLSFILNANRNDTNPNNDIVLTAWPKKDMELLRDATIQFLNARSNDPTLKFEDQLDYVTILEALRKYVRSNNLYWDVRQVPTRMRFDDWENAVGESWDEKQKRK